LENSSEERLSEEEAGNPEVCGRTKIDPFLHELQSGKEVVKPGGQRLHGKEANLKQEKIREDEEKAKPSAKAQEQGYQTFCP